MLRKVKSLLYYLSIYWYHKLIFGKLGYKSKLRTTLTLEYPENIFIGDRVSVGKLAWLAANPLTGAPDCKIQIEDGVYIGNFAHIYCTKSIVIGAKALLADRVYISDNSHEYRNVDISIIDQPITELQTVNIGEHSWIGEGVCIIGANVGKHSIIGSNSVVTKNIPDYCIAVGIPARIIKRYSFEKCEWLKTNEQGDFISK
jgi:acetyltransferase-like isoleucine patch superfamily enzyme